MTIVLMFCALFLAACQTIEQDDGQVSPLVDSIKEPVSPLSPRALQVPPDRLSKVELSKKNIDRKIVLEKTARGWWITSPINAQADKHAMDSIMAALGEIRIVGSVEKKSNPTLREDTNVIVRAWNGNKLATHFIVGPVQGDTTCVQPWNHPSSVRVQGRCKAIFDKPVDKLRHSLITDLAQKDIIKVEYSNEFGRIVLIKTPKNEFQPQTPTIKNFNVQRAFKNIAVVSKLHAKGFVDALSHNDDSGLFSKNTACVTIFLRGKQQSSSINVFIGKRTRGNFLYVRTSESKQIYLVSSHLESSLIPRRSHFERSDEEMRQLREHEKRIARAQHAGDGKGHIHGLPEEPVTQVSDATLAELRALARKQRMSD